MMAKCVSCNNCNHVGWSKPKGSIVITIVLAFFFLVPAIIYEIWRRQGLGQCEQCGSQSIKPSNACESPKQTDLMSLVGLFVVGVVGCFVVVFAYALVTGGPDKTLNARDLQDRCASQGLKHYQDLGQYPTLANGAETSTHVFNVCKNSKDGTFKAK